MAGGWSIALVAHLDADPSDDRARAAAEAQADADRRRPGRAGWPPRDEPDRGGRPVRRARAGRSSTSSPASAAGGPWMPRGSPALYEDATGLLDRLLLRFDRDPPGRGGLTWIHGSSCPALTSILALVFAVALFDQWRERRGGFQLIWGFGMLFYGVGAGCEAIAARGRLERDPVPDVVPDRRRLDGRLARPRDGVPAGPDALRLQLRAVPVPGRPVHVPAPQPARVRRRRNAPAALLHRGRPARPGRRRRDLLHERPLADARRRGRRRRDDPQPRA